MRRKERRERKIVKRERWVVAWRRGVCTQSGRGKKEETKQQTQQKDTRGSDVNTRQNMLSCEASCMPCCNNYYRAQAEGVYTYLLRFFGTYKIFQINKESQFQFSFSSKKNQIFIIHYTLYMLCTSG